MSGVENPSRGLFGSDSLSQLRFLHPIFHCTNSPTICHTSNLSSRGVRTRIHVRGYNFLMNLSNLSSCTCVLKVFATMCLPAILSAPSIAQTANARSVLAPLNVVSESALVIERRKTVSAALQTRSPILSLKTKLDERQKTAQEIALTDQRVASIARAQPGNKPLQVEVFGIYPMRESDLIPATAACKGQPCYRVEIYSFAANATFLAFVDITKKTVVNIIELRNTQPDIPEHLIALANDIANNALEVERALGGKPKPGSALMSSTKTALNRSRCERSRHLCVAPTYVKGERALWAIVDLTDLRLVGTRWTDVGRTAGPTARANAVSEVRLQNEVITEDFCDKETLLERDGWAFKYILTSSDGLRVAGVKYKGLEQFDSVKLVDWHVSYSRKDGFGYSDAVGCPFFSQAAVIAAEPPRVEDIVVDGKKIGFALVQNFWSEGWPTPCNYYYAQRYEFYNDGRFRPAVASVGRGCGNDGIYRPVTRIALSNKINVAEWSGKDWNAWKQERWDLVDEKAAFTKEGYRYRLISQSSSSEKVGFYLEPSRGQFNDGGRGDKPYVYVTKRHTDRDEGDSDLPTLGPCCNTNYEQGPEKYIDKTPESIVDSKLVLWYVPELKNDDKSGKEYCWANSIIENGLIKTKTFPCYSGPMFVPIASTAPILNSVMK